MGATGKEVKPIIIDSVKSSSVSGVGCCGQRKCLAVQFKSGATYHYEGVSQGNYDCLMEANQLGSMSMVTS